MNNLKNRITEEQIDLLHGVLYRDISDKLNDKIFLENLLFSSTILFLNKGEILSFIDVLNRFDLSEIAFEYIEKLEPQINHLEMSEIYDRLINAPKYN